jgi:protein arginine kinase activator
MKCQKCSKPAVVHLTEVVNDTGGVKRAVEIHLCLGHASEAGLVAPGTEYLPTTPHMSFSPHKKSDPKGAGSGADTGLPTAIVPSQPASGGLTVARSKEQPADPSSCPICGLTWTSFKTTGLMGCPHDYELFEGKLSPLLKRAQEGATDHVGKVPRKKKTQETDRQVTSMRLRRELQKAIDAENYEQAARLRDQLKTLEN